MNVATLLPAEDEAEASNATEYDGKFDVTLPKEFDLLDTMGPVRNQRSRGVCSIFSTIGLMEHLYIKEGTITNPDFSEQWGCRIPW